MDLVDRFAKLSSCQVSDALTSAGIANHWMAGIVALEPSRHVAGRAMTVGFEPAAEAEDRRIEYLQHVKPGDVLVLANSGRVDCSVWGGQRTIGAQQGGAVGTVVDGAYRDVEEHRASQYAVYGRAPTVVGSRGTVTPVRMNEVVTAAGVDVAPGDIVVADASGVVVVPQAHEQQVLEAAEALAEKERRVAAAAEQGADFVRSRDGARADSTG